MHTDQFINVIPGNVGHSAVDKSIGLILNDDNAIHGLLYYRSIFFFTFPKGILSPLSFCHIPIDDNNSLFL